MVHLEGELIYKWIEGDEIVLDNVPLTVQGGVGYQLSNAFPRKTQQGDPGPDDHPFNSTHTQRTWVNGCLVRDLDEAGDVGNYWDADAWTQTRGQLSAPLLVVKAPPGPHDPGGISIPHARLGDNLIWTKGNFNGNIYEFQAAEGALRHPRGQPSPVPFRGTITNTGCVFRIASEGIIGQVETQMYLPSTAGYTRLPEGSLDPVDAPDGVEWPTIGFAINENKLYRLTSDGIVFYTISHNDEWQFVGVVTDGSEPRNIYQTYDEDGNRAIGVTTSSGLFLLDHDNAILLKTDFWFPEHAYNGYGAALWRAQDWISNGVGVQRRVGTLITQEGLDNRDGLPSPLAGGFITDLKPSYNWLVAAIAAQPPPRGDEVTPEMVGLTQGLPYPITSSGSVSKQTGAIYIHNGLGWSPFYRLNRHPTRVTVTMILDTGLGQRQQHMFFGDIDGGCYVSLIPATYYNPIQSPNLPVSRTWVLEESRIDWNLKDIPKIAKQINIKADHLYHTTDAHDDPTTPPYFDVPYYNRIQIICNWLDPVGLQHSSEDLDILNGPGPYPFVELVPAAPFDPEETDPAPQSLRGYRPVPYLELRATDSTGNSRRSAPIGWELYKETGRYLPTGLPHESIWMTYRGYNDERNDLTTAVIEWRSIVCRKWSRPNRIFTFNIDCSTAIKDLGTDEATHFLDSICLKVGGVPLVAGDEFYIVDVTRLDGSGEAGLSRESQRTITCLEFTDLQYELDIDGPQT